jgi:hypothetical protein
MDYKFVFARYNEDIDWIKNHSYILLNSVIYNKGTAISGFPNVIGLQNYPIYTREADSYLTYIIENYYNLPEYIFFIQGNPFDHSPDFLNLIHYITTNNIYKSYQPLTSFWKKEHCVPPEKYVEYNTLNYINSYKIYMECCDSSLLPLGFTDNFGIQECLYDFRRHYNIVDPKETLLFLYKRLKITRPYVGYLYFNYGAMFGVSRYNIHKNSYEFYTKLKDFLYEYWTNGYIIERLWFTILG